MVQILSERRETGSPGERMTYTEIDYQKEYKDPTWYYKHEHQNKEISLEGATAVFLMAILIFVIVTALVKG
jgi:hypothetical protein